MEKRVAAMSCRWRPCRPRAGSSRSTRRVSRPGVATSPSCRRVRPVALLRSGVYPVKAGFAATAGAAAAGAVVVGAAVVVVAATRQVPSR